MGLNEFSLIDQYLKPLTSLIKDSSIATSIGDDGAVLNISKNYRLVVSQDTYNVDTHFLPQQNIFDVVTHCLSAAISDLSAMGALAKYFTLSISFEQDKLNEQWLTQLTQALAWIINRYQISLIGGDTTKGPLSLSATVMGVIPKNSLGLQRSQAEVDDLLCVTGFPGSAYLGLQWKFAQQCAIIMRNQFDSLANEKAYQALQKQSMQHNSAWSIAINYQDLNLDSSIISNPVDSQWRELYQQLTQPNLPVTFSNQILLQKLSKSGLDVSDGIIGDLGHLLKQSNVHAQINLNVLQYHPASLKLFTQGKLNQIDLQRSFLYGGDDYQLLFTIKEQDLWAIQTLAKQQQINLQVIGKITSSATNNGDQLTDRISLIGENHLSEKLISYQAFN